MPWIHQQCSCARSVGGNARTAGRPSQWQLRPGYVLAYAEQMHMFMKRRGRLRTHCGWLRGQQTTLLVGTALLAGAGGLAVSSCPSAPAGPLLATYQLCTSCLMSGSGGVVQMNHWELQFSKRHNSDFLLLHAASHTLNDPFLRSVVQQPRCKFLNSYVTMTNNAACQDIACRWVRWLAFWEPREPSRYGSRSLLTGLPS